ncbi:hypothetical protein Tco_0526864 [Tanacetum coccineum]
MRYGLLQMLRRRQSLLTPNIPKAKLLHIRTAHWNSWGDEGHLRQNYSTLEWSTRIAGVTKATSGPEAITKEKCLFMRSCKVRDGSNGNLLWEASVLLGRKKGGSWIVHRIILERVDKTFRGVRVAREDDHGVTKGREDVREVFQQCRSRAKRNLSRCGFGSMLGKREKVIAGTSRQLKVLMKDGMTNVMLYRGVGRRSEAKNEFEIDVRRSDLVIQFRTSIWRDVRTLAIEEAYTTKYSIHPGADMMLCGFRLTNRWLSMKKDIASSVRGPELTWERKDQMRSKCPQLSVDSANASSS